MLQSVRLSVALLALVSVFLFLGYYLPAKSPSLPLFPPKCDPYRSPGFLTASTNLTTPLDLDANRWNPFDTSCVAPRFLRSLIQREPLDWIRNRTIVVRPHTVMITPADTT